MENLNDQLNKLEGKQKNQETFTAILDQFLQEILLHKMSLNQINKKSLDQSQKDKITEYTKKMGELQENLNFQKSTIDKYQVTF